MDDESNANVIRVVLDAEPWVLYWLSTGESDPVHLTSEAAFHLMRQGTPVELAIKAPDDKHSHYETEQVSFYKV